jgi:hypothetical protein
MVQVKKGIGPTPGTVLDLGRIVKVKLMSVDAIPDALDAGVVERRLTRGQVLAAGLGGADLVAEIPLTVRT